MSELKTGFARLDITPPLGTNLAGYYHDRYADGILDPLYATAVVFDDGNRRAVVMSLDLLQFDMKMMDVVRPRVAAAAGTETEAVYLACTHTHLGPVLVGFDEGCENADYAEWMTKRLSDTAALAAADLAPTKISYTRGIVKDVAFVRRFRMKDGNVRTNPGYLNPNIDHPLGEPDENCSLLILRREGKPEIGIINFQVHPDVIGGCKISADYPKFVRDTYETLIPDSRCMYLNGAQGDTNHIDVRLGADKCRGGYSRSRYMGRKIAMAAIANYELAEPLADTDIRYKEKYITVLYNKGREDQLEEAGAVYKIYCEQGEAAAMAYANAEGMYGVSVVAQACRIMELLNEPDEKLLRLSAVAVGDVVFVGFPGEPFTDIGRGVKAKSRFTLTIPTCCTNGSEGYFPMESAYGGGSYEAMTARYRAGTAEKITESAAELVNSL